MINNLFNISPKFYIQKILLDLSLLCAVLSLALWGFNYFPYNITPVGPAQLHYSTSYVGLFLFILSFTWLPLIKKHKVFVFSTVSLILWGYIITRYNGFLYSEDVAFSAILRYRGWLLTPFLYLIWIALIFSMMPRQKAQKIFIYAVMTGFGINSIHVILEVIANLGFDSVKELLISINPYFRLEKINGWWPPPYYGGRVRGLYAEPSFMVSGTLPIFGLCWYFYKKYSNKAWLLPPLCLYVIFLFDTTLTGILAAGFFLYIALLNIIYTRFGKKIAISVAIGLIFLFVATSVTALYTTKKGEQVQETIQTAALIAEYFEKSHEGEKLAPLDISDRPVPVHKFFTRLVTSLVDLEIAANHPLGVGMNLKSQHWKILESSNLNGYEIDSWIKRGYISPLTVYTNYLTELGILGLLLFCYIVYYVMHRTYRYYMESKDNFALAMFFVLLSYLVIFLTQRVDNAFSFIYCLGFTYAYTAKAPPENTQ